MKELDNIPHDTYNQNNILVDEEIINDNPEYKDHNIVNSQDHGLNIDIKEVQIDQNNYLYQMLHKNFPVNLFILLIFFILILLEFIYRRSLFTYSLTY